MILERPARVSKCDVVFAEDLDQSLVHLEEGQVAADAEMRSASELWRK
jgi:hypothetical protein